MASWLQNQLKAAEDLLQAVDRTAQKVSSLRERDDRANTGLDTGISNAPRSVGGTRNQLYMNDRLIRPVIRRFPVG